jgi:hypothetical protein
MPQQMRSLFKEAILSCFSMNEASKSAAPLGVIKSSERKLGRIILSNTLGN